MASTHVNIAEAVKDSINGATLSHDFVAERKFPGPKDQADMSCDPEVFVFPLGHSWEYIDRRVTTWHDYTIQVAIRATLTVDGNEYDQDQIDELSLLAEGIGDHLRDAGQMSGATLVSGGNDPIFEPDQMDEHLFFSGLTFTYRVGRRA